MAGVLVGVRLRDTEVVGVTGEGKVSPRGPGVKIKQHDVEIFHIIM